MKNIFYYGVFVLTFTVTSVQQLHPAQRLLQCAGINTVKKLTQSLGRLGVKLNRPVLHPQLQQTRKCWSTYGAAANPGKKKFNTGPLVAGGLLAGVFGGRSDEQDLKDRQARKEEVIDIIYKEIFQKDDVENVAQLLSYENYVKIKRKEVSPDVLGIPVSPLRKDVCDFVASGGLNKDYWKDGKEIKESLFSGRFVISARPFFQNFSDNDFLDYFS